MDGTPPPTTPNPPLSGVSNDQTEKERKKTTLTLPRIRPVITEQRAAWSSAEPLEKLLKLSSLL